MTNPIVYIDPSERGLYEIIDFDRDIRRAWGVSPMVGKELKLFRTEREADVYSSQHDLGAVVAVDVLSR
jgi:hypothetical protein